MTETDTSRLIFEAPEAVDNGSTPPDEVAHMIDQRDPANDVTQAMIDGTEIVALCGYRWIPSRDPHRFPLCRPCAEAVYRVVDGGRA